MIQGIVTLILFAVFIGIVVWAFSKGKKADFEQAAQLPLDDDSVITIKKGDNDHG